MSKEVKDSANEADKSLKSGRKPHPRRGFKPKMNTPETLKYPKSNDAAWYFKYPEIAKTSASFAFNHRNGDKLTFNMQWAGGNSNSYTRQIDPIGVYYYLLTPGLAKSGDDAINITSKAAWKMLNRRFRGNRTYQQSDFGIIQFGILDFMTSLAEAERIYGLLQYYALNNKQTPDKLLLSMGYYPESFSDLADFRVALNKMVVKARTLCLVKGYSFLDHGLLLSSNVFKDKDTARGQLFTFVKSAFWKYDPTNANGSALILTDHTASYRGIAAGGFNVPLRGQADILKDLQDQLNALLDDDDVDQICSDILAFYGNKEDPAELVTISQVPEDYTVRAIYSDMINRQVHNAVFLGVPTPTSTSVLTDYLTTSTPAAFNYVKPIIYQENNVIKFNLSIIRGTGVIDTVDGYSIRWGGTASENILEHVVDTDILAPTPEDVMEMTRFTASMDLKYTQISSANLYRLEVTAMPSIPLLGASYFRFNSAERSESGGTVTFTEAPSVLNYATNIASYGPFVAIFDWAPLIYTFSTGGGLVSTSPIGDLDNFITMGSKDLALLHEAALLSEFKNPIVDMILKEN